MKISIGITLGVLSVSLALAIGGGAVMAGTVDLATAMPGDVKVIVDNDRVRVLDVVHKPGVKEPLHTHPNYVTVDLSDSRVRVTSPDGKSVEKDRKAGTASYSGPTTHTLENIGTGDLHVIVIELKK